MRKPDFAHTDLSHLEDRDLRFIIEQFPVPGRSYAEIARLVHTFPTTLESLLNSRYLFDKVCVRSKLLLDISPFLLFNVLLRHNLMDHRARLDRKIINYLANLLTLFVRTERMLRVQLQDEDTHEYLVGLIDESQSADSARKFLIYAHIGNYSLFISGLFPGWIEYRYRFKRRPVNTRFYVDFGRSYFQQAAAHRLAREFGLDDVFLRLSLLFDLYKASLNQIAKNHLGLA